MLSWYICDLGEVEPRHGLTPTVVGAQESQVGSDDLKDVEQVPLRLVRYYLVDVPAAAQLHPALEHALHRGELLRAIGDRGLQTDDQVVATLPALAQEVHVPGVERVPRGTTETLERHFCLNITAMYVPAT